MKETYTSVYLMAKGFPLAEDLERLYAGNIPQDHPLAQFLYPKDQRGEVAAWGGPHWTVLDALTVEAPAEFARIVRRLTERTQVPIVVPKHLAVLPGTSLVLRCEIRGLDELRAALIEQTRSLIVRVPLTDEEIQRAFWWADLHDEGQGCYRKMLEQSLRFYRAAGSPALPSSRHFRLGFLVRLFKEWRAAPLEQQGNSESRFRYYLSTGEPPWYQGKADFHLTLASGLLGHAPLSQFVDTLWGYVAASFRESSPRHLAILTEDEANPVSVHFYDWLTERAVGEVRPGFKVEGIAHFKP